MERWKNWELWPFWLRYLNITPTWFWYCLRSGTPWFFTPSNPTITFGGFEGESKREMYEQLPPSSFPKTIYIQPGIDFQLVRNQIEDAGFQFPFIVKPDVGMAGILFRKLDGWEQLEKYHQRMPVDYLVQDLVLLPVEYSVFYYRFPDAQKGVITGFLQKEPLHVIGDGQSTIRQLIETHPQAKFRLDEMLGWHQEVLNNILENGEKKYLSYAANLNRGASFINLHTQIDETLHKVIDELNHYSKTFYYGRYDLKAASLEALKRGDFLVLEYNGSGAEPNHVYHSGYTLRAAHNEILKHWKILYQISKCSHKKGIAYFPLLDGWRFLKKAGRHFALLKKLDATI